MWAELDSGLRTIRGCYSMGECGGHCRAVHRSSTINRQRLRQSWNRGCIPNTQRWHQSVNTKGATLVSTLRRSREVNWRLPQRRYKQFKALFERKKKSHNWRVETGSPAHGEFPGWLMWKKSTLISQQLSCCCSSSLWHLKSRRKQRKPERLGFTYPNTRQHPK